MSRRRRTPVSEDDSPFEYTPVSAGDETAPRYQAPVHDPAPTPVPVVTAGLHVTGDLAVATGAHVHESLRVDGKLHLGRGARVQEAVSVAGDVEVGDDVHVGAALETDGAIRWGRNAEASRVACRGAFILEDGVARATSLIARRGVHPGPARRDS